LKQVDYQSLIAGLRQKKKSYVGLFGKGALLEGDALKDLAWFCHGFLPYEGDRDHFHVLEGRRQVWLRICEYLQLEPEEIAQLYTQAIREGER
jgi:hypothetical protein